MSLHHQLPAWNACSSVTPIFSSSGLIGAFDLKPERIDAWSTGVFMYTDIHMTLTVMV